MNISSLVNGGGLTRNTIRAPAYDAQRADVGVENAVVPATPYERAEGGSNRAPITDRDEHDPAPDRQEEIRDLPPKRLFDRRLDIALLKEVSRKKEAHMKRRGSRMEAFQSVAESLNRSGILPWNTDYKHCADRLRLILNKHKVERMRSVRRSGDLQELFDLCEEIWQEDINAEQSACAQGIENEEHAVELFEAGDAIRGWALKRKTPVVDLVSSECTINEPMGGTQKSVTSCTWTPGSRRKKSRTYMDTNDAYAVLEHREAQRISLLEAKGERDELLLNLEVKRFEKESKRAEKRLELDETAMQLREKSLNAQIAMDERADKMREMMLGMMFALIPYLQTDQ